MSARSRAFSPSAERHQRGAAVVLALLTVVLAATLASAALADLALGIDVAEGRTDRAHARELALGAVDWARHVLADDQRNSAVDHPGEPWAIRIPPTPLFDDPAQGTIAGHIEDRSGRFNLNDLVADNAPNAAAQVRFATLLTLLGEPPAQAQSSAAQLVAWLLTHGPLSQSAELGRLPGFDAALVERLEPLVAALPAASRINLNTAPPEVLATLVPGLGLDAARAMAVARERTWYRNTADFTSRLPQGLRMAEGVQPDVRSRHFLITIQARHGVSVTRLEALVDRQRDWPTILWMRSP